MSDVQVPSAIEPGRPWGSGQLLLLVYDQLRRLAAAKLAKEPSGPALDATLLVHEAYMKLGGRVAWTTL